MSDAQAAALQALAAFCACAAACALLLWALLRSGLAWRLAIDAPNARSLHVRPTPRVGGVALTSAWLAWTAVRHGLPPPVLLAALALAAISFVDDRRHVPSGVRLAIQCAAAASIAFVPPQPGWPALALVALAVAWMANLYNFMDGSDGLAGSMALVGFGAYAVAATQAGAAGLAGVAGAAAGAAAGFLLFNWPPARLFLGDMGSVPLGFLAGVLGYAGWQRGAWPAWFPVLVFAPFVADASLTLLARLARGERVWQAHREHTYQRMVAHGYGHRGTLLRWLGVMIAAAGSALGLLQATPAAVAAGLALWAALLLGGFLLGKRIWPRTGGA